ncbi:MAG: Uma2 family endonuclease [Saprospiraceae bacterium]|nr:Uma2 family endonuclease [Saprospiraceae bacterium]MCF8251034.1 Uma2 family endonuclease [Saprospiraceae bacterium]MCF8281490.1 Uma2 family endonuclease [Bacteroidales bacterium]MCF8311631.1 Uma2 family endonuclease [Saprospiraceae bacterium]MCF8440972.1 Uma2 family endonuclease [Saprospiraceae bacterium]
MTAEAVKYKFSVEDYLELEYSSPEKHEFVDGKLRTMAYASENHRHICSNVNFLLQVNYRERAENIFTNQTLVYTPVCERYYYPDATIFPSEIAYKDYRGKMKSALNPLTIIEVLSDSTEQTDRGEKWKCYQNIPSLRQYVLIAQDEMQVEIYTRIGESECWTYRSFDEVSDAPTIGDFEVPMAEIYRKVVFAESKTDEAESLVTD